MDNKIPTDGSNPLDKSKHRREEEAIEAFKYFESANIRNRDAFSELLNYTIENRRNPHS